MSIENQQRRIVFDRLRYGCSSLLSGLGRSQSGNRASALRRLGKALPPMPIDTIAMAEIVSKSAIPDPLPVPNSGARARAIELSEFISGSKIRSANTPAMTLANAPKIDPIVWAAASTRPCTAGSTFVYQIASVEL